MKAIRLSLYTAIVSGFSVFINGLFVTKTDPVVFVLIRNTFVAVLMLLFLVYRGKFSHVIRLKKNQLFTLILIGFVGGGLPFGLFFWGLSLTGPVLGNLINKSLFLWAAVLAVPFLHEKINKIQAMGYLIVFLSLFVLTDIRNSNFFEAGTFLVLSATLFWAIEQIIAKIALKNIDYSVLAWARIFFGIPVLYLFVMLQKNTGLIMPVFSQTILPALLSAGFLCFYMFFWYQALKIGSVVKVSSILILAPVLTAILDIITGNKSYSNIILIQQIFMILGISMIVGFGGHIKKFLLTNIAKDKSEHDTESI